MKGRLIAILVALAVLVVFLSPDPSVGITDAYEAVLDGDYTLVVELALNNYSGPGLAILQVEASLAGRTFTRRLHLFLLPGERRVLEVRFDEVNFLETVLTLAGGLVAGAWDSLNGQVKVWLIWPPWS